MSFEEMARKVSQKWHQANEQIKAKYQALADADRVRYDTEKTAYAKRLKKKSPPKRRDGGEKEEDNNGDGCGGGGGGDDDDDDDHDDDDSN